MSPYQAIDRQVSKRTKFYPIVRETLCFVSIFRIDLEDFPTYGMLNSSITLTVTIRTITAEIDYRSLHRKRGLGMLIESV